MSTQLEKELQKVSRTRITNRKNYDIPTTMVIGSKLK